MDFELADGNSIRLLAPFTDMLNHSSEIKQCHVYDVLSGSLSVLAGKEYEVGDQVCSSRSLTNSCAYLGCIFLRFLSIMDLFQIIASYVSMALSYLVTPTTAMISFFQRTRMRHFSSKSINSGYWLDLIQTLLSPSPSSIRYRKVSFDISAFSD